MAHAYTSPSQPAQVLMSPTKTSSIVHIIDDDEAVRNSISMLLSVEGFKTKEFSSAIEFLENYHDQPGCIVTDVEMPSMTGLELQKKLQDKNIHIPVIFITGQGNIAMSVKAMKYGAIDFLEKPFINKDLMQSVRSALEIDNQARELKISQQQIKQRFELLTEREKHVLLMLTKDHAKLTNKDIAKELSISKRTVEVHRSSVMAKMLAQTRAELVELSKLCDLSNFN